MIKFEAMLTVSYADLRKGKIYGKSIIIPPWQRGDRWSTKKHTAAETAINSGAFLPPIVLAKMGSEFLVVDGGHRLRKIQSPACRNASGFIGAVVVTVATEDEAIQVFSIVNDGTKVSSADKDFALDPTASKRQHRSTLKNLWGVTEKRAATVVFELGKLFKTSESLAGAIALVEQYCEDPEHSTNRHIAAALWIGYSGTFTKDFSDYADSLEKLPGRSNNEISAWFDTTLIAQQRGA